MLGNDRQKVAMNFSAGYLALHQTDHRKKIQSIKFILYNYVKLGVIQNAITLIAIFSKEAFNGYPQTVNCHLSNNEDHTGNLLRLEMKELHNTFCYDIYKWSFSTKWSLLYFLWDMTENAKSRPIANSSTLTGNLFRQEMKEV